jgi:hypothetical protein
MDLQEIFRAIPRGRELRLSHNEHGIQLRVDDRSTDQLASISRMISGMDLIRAGAVIEKVFFEHLRTMNVAIDRKLSQ